MSILIVGSEGAQGKRYRSILKYLRIPYYCKDIDVIPFEPPTHEGIIIATPTDTHEEVIREHLRYKVPILIEKPIAKDVGVVEKLFKEAEKAGVQLSMVYQYRHLAQRKNTGPSVYNYFRHGNDGLIWDCLQIIGLAKGKVTLAEDSPVWHCQINGQFLRIEEMDLAYIKEVWDWQAKKTRQTTDEIISIHKKVQEFRLG